MSGVIKEYNTLEDGRRQVAEFYSAVEMFGFSESEDQLHTAEAITPCTVRCYPREAFMKTVAASPALSASFLKTLMTRLHRARERMVMIGRMSAIQRVATFLLRLADDQEARANVHLAMSRPELPISRRRGDVHTRTKAATSSLPEVFLLFSLQRP